MKSNKRRLLVSFCAVFAVVALAGCGKSASEGNKLAVNQPPGDNPQQSCSTDQLVTWQFIQPEPTVSKSVDILFVVNTSLSWIFQREEVAEHFPDFLAHMPPGADYRVAVMEAHGGDSDWTGKLYSPKGVPPVLSSQSLSPKDMQKDLHESLCSTAADPGPSEGEMPMYSFMRSLGADRLPEIKSQGFYRDDAALSVVFVTNRNDLCYPPELHGFKKFPDNRWDPFGDEMAAYKKYCLNGDGSESVTPAKVLAGVEALKGGLPFSIGGAIHIDPTKVPILFDDTIGHGILELVQLAGAVNGLPIELTETNYSPDLSRISDLSHLISHLESDFDLSAQTGYDPTTVKVQIDGYPVPSHYDAATHLVYIDGGNLGHANSVVNVSACKPGSGNPSPIGT
jgi:hypothetical protein